MASLHKHFVLHSVCEIVCLSVSQEQIGRWPLLLSWVLDSLSHQNPLPVAEYEERGQLRDTI